jgi:hypothetical protein
METKKQLWHVECTDLPLCKCSSMALRAAGGVCEGYHSDVREAVRKMRAAGWPTAHAVKGECPAYKEA